MDNLDFPSLAHADQKMLNLVSVDTKHSFVQFVYPFLFDTEFSTLVEIVEGIPIEDPLKDGNSTADEICDRVWCRDEFPSEDLSRHVSEYLKVEDPDFATARIWNLNGYVSSMHGLDHAADWVFHIGNSDPKICENRIPIRFSRDRCDKCSLQLILFRIGVGMFTIEAAPKDRSSIENWLEFVHYFRFVAGHKSKPGDTEPVAEIERSYGPTRDKSLSAIFKRLLGAVGENLPKADGKHIEKQEWWREAFVPGRVIPFAALYVDGLPKEYDADLRYRLRHFHCKEHEIGLCDDVVLNEEEATLIRAKRKWFLFSIEGGAFLACDAEKGYFRDQLPNHLRNDYFMIFLLALHQRFALIRMSEEVAQEWLSAESDDDKGRGKTFERIRDTLLAFTARGYFAQVAQRINHHRCYLKWQEVFQVERLYAEVRDEVRDMHEYLQKKQSEKQQQIVELYGRIFAFVSISFAAPGVFFALLSINVSEFHMTVRQAEIYGAIFAVACLSVIGLLMFVGVPLFQKSQNKGILLPKKNRVQKPRNNHERNSFPE